MAKRKRDKSNSQGNANIRSNKTPKLDPDKQGLARDYAHRRSSALSQRPEASASLSTQLAQTQANAPLQPPDGLNRNARKRWRKRQRLTNSTTRKTSIQTHPSPSTLDSGNESRPLPIKEGEPRTLKSSVDRNTLKQHAVTNLMPLRKRTWLNRSKDLGISKLNQQPSQLKRSARMSSEDESESSISSNEDNQPAHLLPSERLATNQRRDSVSSTTSRSSSESHERGVKQSSSSRSNARDHSEDLVGETKPEGTVTTSAGLQQSFKPSNSNGSLSTISLRRPSFSKRALSVPFHSNDVDIEEEFKRFSAFVEGSESSDDETEDSDIDDSEKKTGKMEHSIENSTVSKASVEDVDATATNQPSARGDREETITTASLEEGLEQQKRGESDGLPLFSDAPSRPSSTNASSWPANVGIKRQLSAGDQESKGCRARSDVPVEQDVDQRYSSAPLNQPDPLQAYEEDTQDVLRTIDEVSRNIFGSTRPLPASKPPLSPDPEILDQENGVLTFASSDRRVTRSMLTPQSPRIGKESPRSIQGWQNDIVCNSVQVPEALPIEIGAAKESYSKQSDDASGYTSENIDVAYHGLESGQAGDGLDTSSSLSELSRSPSAPPLPNEPKIEEQYGNEEVEMLGHDEIRSLYKGQELEPPPKKRKMTGRTSKHFTPIKPKRSKQISTKSEDEQADSLGVLNDDKADLDQDNDQEVQQLQKADISERQARRRRLRSSTKANTKAPGTNENDLPNNNDDVKIEATKVEDNIEAPPVSASTRSLTKRKRKSTGKRSSYFLPPRPALDLNLIDRVDLYNTTAGGKKHRVPAGTSTAPVPSIHSERFGIIQEKLWREPFWLLIAVTFLNKTTGRAAVPIFWALKERYPTPEALAEAKQEDLHDMIYHLGLQRQRSKKLIKIAKAWVEAPPEKGRRWRTLHYPFKGNGKGYKTSVCVEEDSDEVQGALEIGLIPGCGPYAWDSWRIFCRDLCRGVAEDYNGSSAGEGFVPEWQKVLPLDKELRACLRWMWLREGWIWDCETGKKRMATNEEMQRAVLGEMEIVDSQERKFAAQAAGVDVAKVKEVAEEKDEKPGDIVGGEEKQPRTPEPAEDATDMSDNIVVTPSRKPVRRSARLTA